MNARTDVDVDVDKASWPSPPRTCLTALGYQELSRPFLVPLVIGTVSSASDAEI